MTKENALIIKNITGGFKESVKVFSYTIYRNFDYYKQDQNMHHTLEDISKLLKSKDMYCLLVYNINHKLIAYLIGEIIKLDNGKMVFFINYLYVIEKYRNLGIGSKLLNIIIKRVQNWKIHGIMLLVDSTNDYLNTFFANRNFHIDETHRRNERFEILSYG
jgi:ribosomal protein S18 acetylase RimI-like enzyme